MRQVLQKCFISQQNSFIGQDQYAILIKQAHDKTSYTWKFSKTSPEKVYKTNCANESSIKAL
jgi:hypothetical protein